MHPSGSALFPTIRHHRLAMGGSGTLCLCMCYPLAWAPEERCRTWGQLFTMSLRHAQVAQSRTQTLACM